MSGNVYAKTARVNHRMLKMDAIDRANAQAERWLKAALFAQLNRPVAHLPVHKLCLNCQEPLPKPELNQPVQRWCDADCQSDWSRRQ